ncbi:hypothetical protein EMIT0P258_50251 [Pseudomonas sp. IT-P258]
MADERSTWQIGETKPSAISSYGEKQLSQLKHAVYDGRSFATGDRVTGLSPQGGRLMRNLFLTLLHQEISNERTRRQTSP